MKEKTRSIKVTSSLNKISTDQLGNRVRGGDITLPPPPPPLSTAEAEFLDEIQTTSYSYCKGEKRKT
jgi:hypothetical protein